MDPVTKLDCYNSSVHGSKWWSGCIGGGGSPWNTKFSGLINIQVRVGLTLKELPCREIWHTPMQHSRSHVVLWKKAQKWVWGASGIFDGWHLFHLWHFLRHDSCFRVVEPVMPHQEGWILVSVHGTLPRREFYTWAICVRENIGMIKALFLLYGICFLSAFSFIWLRPQAVAKQRLVCCSPALVTGWCEPPLLLL